MKKVLTTLVLTAFVMLSLVFIIASFNTCDSMMITCAVLSVFCTVLCSIKFIEYVKIS